MAARKYFVNNGQSNVGPFEMHAIIEKVGKGELRATDRLCVNADADEWVLICQHPEFLNHFENTNPKATLHAAPEMHAEGQDEGQRTTKPHVETHNEPNTAIKNTPVPEHTGTFHGDITTGQWYVLKGKNRFGPFMYLDVVRMLQDKSVFEYDYVWTQGLEGWKRIAEISCFQPDHIRALFGSEDNAENEIFHRRNFPRARYETSIIVHDNNNIWKGKTIELSEGGAGIVVENAMILPGQNVYLHFKPGPLSKSFNVLCEVVSKRYVKGIRDKEAPVVYGIKFVNIQKQDREAIRNIHSAA